MKTSRLVSSTHSSSYLELALIWCADCCALAFDSMDSRVAILGANGTGKSTLLHLITSVLQPVKGTVSRHSALKLAKYSQHSADQLPYDKSPIEYFESLYHEKFPEKDIMVSYCLDHPLERQVVLMSLIFYSSGDNNLGGSVLVDHTKLLQLNNYRTGYGIGKIVVLQVLHRGD